jgi:hypothetical protein
MRKGLGTLRAVIRLAIPLHKVEKLFSIKATTWREKRVATALLITFTSRHTSRNLV